MAQLRTLPWCIMHALVQVVPRNEAFTHAMPRCHHGYCMSSAGNAGGADEAGHESTLSSDYQQSRLAFVEGVPRRYTNRSFNDDLDTQDHDELDDRWGFGL